MTTTDDVEQPRDRGPAEPASAVPGYLAIRSFVVRALLEPAGEGGPPRWRGQVTDVASGERRSWSHPAGVAHFVEARLQAESEPATDVVGRRAAVMAAPAMTDVVTDMLAVLEARLPGPTPPLPDANVTLVRVRERLVGLGHLRGSQRVSPLGPQTLRGGRLDGRVRFQLWGDTPGGVDAAVVDLHGTLLDQSEQLRGDGFLRFAATDTTLAEHVDDVGGWRKTTAYDVLYEFAYRDSDDAPALIARIPVHTDPEEASSPDRESATVTDDLVRWDDEGAAALVVAGPRSVRTVDVLSFVAGTDPGGTVTLRRSDGSGGAPQVHADLPGFLAAVGGDEPDDTHAEVALTPTALLAALAPAGDTVDLGDWNTDGVVDTYDPLRLDVAPAIGLPTSTDRLEITYSDPSGLDAQAVLYVSVDAP